MAGKKLMFGPGPRRVAGLPPAAAAALSEGTARQALSGDPPWTVLIVDDEPEVHRITELALSGFHFAGRGLEFLNAQSAEQARLFLTEHDSIAVVLLDVVMESEHAGLELVRWIREDLGNSQIRIVLRTGQPGQAPERDVIASYDINDYKEKTELTARKLTTLMFACLRAWRDINALEANRRGLNLIIQSSQDLFRQQSMERFTLGALEQLGALLQSNRGAFFGTLDGVALHGTGSGRGLSTIAGIGRFKDAGDIDLERVLPPALYRLLDGSPVVEGVLHHETSVMCVFRSYSGSVNVLYLDGLERPKDVDTNLVQVFSRNIAIAFDNLEMVNTIDATQRELLQRLGEAVESRSQETGNHVRRVAELSWILARAVGMDAREADVIRQASPLHDVGKIGIPDDILHKPGKLTPEEWEQMKSHVEIGERLLTGSDLQVIRCAASIAGNHHERWDGLGYPRGLKGGEIPLDARITSIADVFDALSSARCYKPAWPREDVLAYFQAQRGQQFDPVLVDLLFANISAIEDLYQRLGDDV
ncbi:DUF3369 domain-containing protein [Novispirillum itersonii]|uniref:Response regulator RpfG family c-di-GMP phosphodiesterase n=1 Tax=Novispirillum itersonii TaxID=189 RepID=A0A7W9ZDN8_NOVIT|nr:DUF3369 domain-containing protein [Novispirillum itersonii]MBB6209606.1 response regulator RpfG family c-di-GMP phosphodiesterase [Novispirillum itersonii]